MPKVTDIRDHPKWREKNEHRLLMDEMPSDPSQADLDYLASLDDQEDPLGLHSRSPLEDLQTREEPKPEPKYLLSICVACEFKKDVRPRWRRFLFPNGAALEDLVCRAFPGMQAVNPVTGKEGYIPQGTQIASLAEEHHQFPRCGLINIIGACGLFKPKITYR